MVQFLLPCLVLVLPIAIGNDSLLTIQPAAQDPVIDSDPSPSDIIPPAESSEPTSAIQDTQTAEADPASTSETPVESKPSADSHVNPSGCWSGSWLSCKSGHHGVLRATLTPCGDHAYRAEFRGRFFKIMPFRYTVTLQVVGVDQDGVHLAGSQSLGRLFGTFHYRATITDCRFEATYRSCKDWGKFSLGR